MSGDLKLVLSFVLIRATQKNVEKKASKLTKFWVALLFFFFF